MAGRGQGPDFVEALARGLDVLGCFGADHPRRSLSEVAAAAGLARPTARRLLLTHYFAELEPERLMLEAATRFAGPIAVAKEMETHVIA